MAFDRRQAIDLAGAKAVIQPVDQACQGHVIPFGMAIGNPGHLAGLNLVGLKRRGFEREAIHNLRAAYRMIFSNEGTLRERVEDAGKLFEGDPLVSQVIAFIQRPSSGTLMLPHDGAEMQE